MKGQPKVRRTNFQDFGHFGPFLTFLTDDLSLFLIKFWSFLVIFGRFWVDLGSGRGLNEDGGSRQRAAEGLTGSGEGSGTEVRRWLEVNFGHFGPSGVKI